MKRDQYASYRTERDIVASRRKVQTRAERQCGLVTRDQALACGMTRDQIHYMIRAGVWTRVHPRVFRLWKVDERWHQNLWAASLWLENGQPAISHRAAAVLHGVGVGMKRVVELSLLPEFRRHRNGVLVHGVREWKPNDLINLGGLRTTSLPRTLLDLGAVCKYDAVESVVEECLRRRRISIERIEARLDLASRGQRGAGTLRAFLRRYPGVPTGSDLELEFERFLRTYRFPRPTRQHEISDGGGWRHHVDFAYPRQRVAIEIQSFEWHSQRNSIDADAEIVSRLSAAGWKPLLVTKTQLRADPFHLIHRLESVGVRRRNP